ncbi:MAG: hypothetical protein LBS56_08275, partial [Propionibacteriaceae bacterium]|nr:hypothetical protein [Propionibacteriaceae bacterium]
MVRRQKVVRGVVVAAFWLAAWEVAALVVAKDILLVSPLAAARTLVTLAGTLGFWQTVAYSLLRIGAGFLIAVAAGVALAALAHVHPWVHAVLSPAIRAIRSIPVVSFIILVLIWASSSVLSTTIAG